MAGRQVLALSIRRGNQARHRPPPLRFAIHTSPRQRPRPRPIIIDVNRDPDWVRGLPLPVVPLTPKYLADYLSGCPLSGALIEPFPTACQPNQVLFSTFR